MTNAVVDPQPATGVNTGVASSATKTTVGSLQDRILDNIPAAVNAAAMREFARDLVAFQLATVGKLLSSDASASKPVISSEHGGDAIDSIISTAPSTVVNLPAATRTTTINSAPADWVAPSNRALQEAYELARFASAAYCAGNKKLSTWSCRRHCEPFKGQVEVKGILGSADETSARGFVAAVGEHPSVADGKQIALVSVRGAADTHKWVHSLSTTPASHAVPGFPGDKDCAEEPRVHAYFYERIVNNIKDHAIALLSQLFLETQAPERPKQVYVVGHGLGAAGAVLLAIELLHAQLDWLHGKTIKVFTYGSPRIGNPAFSRLVHRLVQSGQLQIARVTSGGDPVPSLPPRSLGYKHHAGRWLLLGSGASAHTLVAPNGSAIADAEQAEEGADIGAWTPSSDPLAHLRAWNLWFGPYC
ncbi:Alpha/Beta hydrolase protein [Thamnocephalis sphaerospora]|uniref:Alpha/Beta hydrolase protein n=1 Tax=Thamnocephalis sphaerospora TaxID=78915 RepID=A0A4P9XH23_9FUNG|nr:Alpha/Beta hydrolase protein [Thamnocephalis sphaerospora]|eukprot:RKP04965.1 Alpha/Beta hydrolase protein [Thamnocephalis sphaerospora]